MLILLYSKVDLYEMTIDFPLRMTRLNASITQQLFQSHQFFPNNFMSIQIRLNTETLQSAKGNRDLSCCLNWVLFLTVAVWLFGIMIFVVSPNSKFI